MYKELLEDLKEEYKRLENFTGDYLKNYIEQKETFKNDIIDIIDTIKFNKNFSQAKREGIRAFYGDKVSNIFEAEVNYYNEIIEQLNKLKEEIDILQDFKVNFITNNKESLKKYLENEEIDKLAKMIIIEGQDGDGCMLHFNNVYKNYAGHGEKFYEYLCAVCDTDCFADEGDEDEIEEYKASHFFHLSPEEVVQYAKETIDKD